MGIICKVCDREFKSTITNSHLKNHSMTTAEYAAMYGQDSLSSAEYKLSRSEKMKGENNPNFGNTWDLEQRQNMSEKMVGREAWNKGHVVTDGTILSNIREGISNREMKYSTGELSRVTYDRTDEVKTRIAAGVKEYAKNNPEVMSNRSKKAIKTKQDNGHELAFFRGMKHSDESKAKVGVKSKESWALRKVEMHEARIERMKSFGYDILAYNETDGVTFKCDKCNSVHTYHVQCTDPCRLSDRLCPTCNPRYLEKSIKQNEIYERIKTICPDASINYRGYNGRNEIDIYVPSKGIGFEYNGIYWHSQTVLEANGNSKTRDYEKYLDALECGIRIYSIFEDEYLNSPEIVLDRIYSILGAVKKSIYARKCKVAEIDSNTANRFIDANHMQGSGRSVYRLGLYFGDELVSVMTFANGDISRGLKGWEINRFVSLLGYSVVGGASKLFAHFVKEKTPTSVISYADTRWSDGKVYSAIGFAYDSKTPPNYWYFKGSAPKRWHRYSLRKNSTDNQSLTEYENRLLAGYDRVYDYGSTKWAWTKP